MGRREESVYHLQLSSGWIIELVTRGTASLRMVMAKEMDTAHL